MSASLRRCAVIALLLAGGAATSLAQHAGHGATEGTVGRVAFGNSCSPAAQPDFTRGVALLHSFWFPAAIAASDASLEKDPSCAMSWWGKAMSYWG